MIYDRSLDVYLAAYPAAGGVQVRASRDLIHWSKPIGTTYSEAGHALYYPTLLGETGDPTVGGLAPRLYFSSFPVNGFPDYATATFESVPLVLTPQPKRRAVKH